MYCDREILYIQEIHTTNEINLHTKFFGCKSLGFWLTFVILSLHQMTPLHLAAESGRIKILKYLIDQGIDINLQDDNGVTTSNMPTNSNAARSSLSFMCYVNFMNKCLSVFKLLLTQY